MPREGELLCEHCGYGLTGVADDGRCPECGGEVADSTTADGRVLPAWEMPGGGSVSARLAKTTWAVLARPGRFFRTLRTRVERDGSRSFAFVQHWAAGYLFALAASVHLIFVVGGRWDLTSATFMGLLGGTAMTPVAFGLIWGTRALAGRLTTLEAKYHGLRMPTGAVSRALNYHSAALLPVAVGTVGLVAGYRVLLATDVLDRGRSELAYLYVLCAWVVVAAGYLFWSYWQAMKNVMYANR